MPWIDTHCHLDADEFDARPAEVLARARGGRRRADRAAGGGRGQLRRRARTGARGTDCAYALGIHPLYVDRAADGDLDTLARGAGQRTATTRAWWRWARSGSTTSCPASTASARRASMPRSSSWRATFGAAGDPARAPLGRRSAQAAAPHRRARRHRACVQRQRAAGGGLRRAGLPARLRRRDDLRARAADPAPRRRTAARRRWCWRPTRPTSRRSGSTGRAEAARRRRKRSRNEPAELPRIAADAGRAARLDARATAAAPRQCAGRIAAAGGARCHRRRGGAGMKRPRC